MKCPSKSCNFWTLSIPDLQVHIAECSGDDNLDDVQKIANNDKESGLAYVDVKEPIAVSTGSVNPKREHIKQEPVDPLGKHPELKLDNARINQGDGDDIEDMMMNEDERFIDVISVSDSLSTAAE